MVFFRGATLRRVDNSPPIGGLRMQSYWGGAGLPMGGLLPAHGRRFPLPPTPGSSGTGRTETCVSTARSVAEARHLDNLAGELTLAAYHVALQHAAAGTWLDLELDLWRALSDAVKIARARENSPRLASICTADASPRSGP